MELIRYDERHPEYVSVSELRSFSLAHSAGGTSTDLDSGRTGRLRSLRLVHQSILVSRIGMSRLLAARRRETLERHMTPIS